MKKSILKFILIACAFFTVERFCHKQTHGFRLQKIRSHLTFCSDWEIDQPRDIESIKVALDQPFHFLTSGGQCYAFESEDQTYIFKVFKHHHLRSNPKKLNQFYESIKIAYDHFRKQTGLIYIHLNKTDHIQHKVTLIDPIGIKHTLDLDSLEFTLQKKASMAYPTINALMQREDKIKAKQRISSLIDLIYDRCEAGILDHDPVMKRNFGFIGDQAIEIDLGSFELDSSLKTLQRRRRTLFFETMKLRRWISKNHPELSSYLEKEIENRLDQGL